MTTDLQARVARALAQANGDDYDALPRDKAEMRLRWRDGTGDYDVNGLRQVDYNDMATAAMQVFEQEQTDLRDDLMMSELERLGVQ